MITPRGFGVFFRRSLYAMRGTEMAKRADLTNGIFRWAAFQLDTPDALDVDAKYGFRVDRDRLVDAVECFRDRANIAPWLWSFPGERALSNPEEHADWIAELADAVDASGIILDLEAPCKLKPIEVHKLVARVRRDNQLHCGLAISSFPLRDMHPGMPWAEMTAGVGIPQLYKTAATRKLANQAISEWGALGRPVFPALAAYNTSAVDSATQVNQLQRDLRNVCLNDDGTPRVNGAIIWSDPQLDMAERRLLQWFKSRVGW